MIGSLDSAVILYFISLALATFWAFALLGLKSTNKIPNKLLATLLFLIAAALAISILRKTGFILELPHLIGVTWWAAFVYPPLFYLYVKSLTGHSLRLKSHVWHFIPFLICLIYVTPFYFQSADEKIALFNAVQRGESTTGVLVAISILIQETLYFVMSLILLARHAHAVKQNFSTLRRNSLRWLQLLVFTYAAVIAIFSYFSFSDQTLPDLLAPLACVFFIYALGYLGLRQPSVFSSGNGALAGHKYKKSGLTAEQARAYIEKLQRFVEEEKPYLDSNLTLPDLAKRLAIQPNHLSQVLNEYQHQTFYDFINTYRVEEAKRQLCDASNDHLTILTLAYESGFNSKSSFNSVFKKHVKMTPSEYKKQANGSA